MSTVKSTNFTVNVHHRSHYDPGKGAQGLKSWTGGWLVSPAAGSKKKRWNPLYFELRMYI